ncbi:MULTISPECIES: Imm32 family immunity protein [Pseudomonas]|jgi:hypothetical protein|uniref:Imm32 family immunity protein n=1 Tax=Pseudomonas fluorescens TaxID=294 RepID=UPI00054C4AD0|nr:hypothetical protein RY26_19060 [Pseudomonas fluorescens]
MRRLRDFSIHGTAVDCDQNIKLDEISILADPGTIRALGVFLISASYEMEINGLEHIHLQDLVENFSSKKHVDLVAINKKMVGLLGE